jgi:hypothetical protein
VEVAVYSILSQLWEIETGKVYAMTKANDIFSGLGVEEGPKKEEASTSDITQEDRVEELRSDGEDEVVIDVRETHDDDEIGVRDVEKEQHLASAYEGVRVRCYHKLNEVVNIFNCLLHIAIHNDWKSTDYSQQG